MLWLNDYLRDRASSVTLQDVISKPFQRMSGVPQGTVLAPYIFAAFFGDYRCTGNLGNAVGCVKYADDLTLILPIYDTDSAHVNEIVLTTVNDVSNWCERNNLSLNVSKSKAVICLKNSDLRNPSLYSFPVDIVPSVNILGITISETLSWEAHVNNIIKVVNKRFYVLRKLRPFVSSDELHQVYTSYVRSVCEYACPVFVSLNRILNNRLARVDKRAHMIIFRDDPRTCQCSLREIENRRLLISKQLFIKAESDNTHTLHKLTPERLLHTGVPCVPLCRTVKMKDSFFPFMASFMCKTQSRRPP